MIQRRARTKRAPFVLLCLWRIILRRVPCLAQKEYKHTERQRNSTECKIMRHRRKAKSKGKGETMSVYNYTIIQRYTKASQECVKTLTLCDSKTLNLSNHYVYYTKALNLLSHRVLSRARARRRKSLWNTYMAHICLMRPVSEGAAAVRDRQRLAQSASQLAAYAMCAITSCNQRSLLNF